jgi:hypothetical protein
MRELKREFRRLAPFRVQAAHKPSFLKEALDECSRPPSSYTGRKFKKGTLERYYDRMLSPDCSCQTNNGGGAWTFGGTANVAINYRKVFAKDCSAHTDIKTHHTHIRCFMQSTILSNLVKLSFEAIHGAGGFSIGLQLRAQTKVQKLPLESLFRDLYHERYLRNKKKGVQLSLCPT